MQAGEQRGAIAASPGRSEGDPREASVGAGKKLGIQGGGEPRELPDGQDVVCLSQATAVTS